MVWTKKDNENAIWLLRNSELVYFARAMALAGAVAEAHRRGREEGYDEGYGHGYGRGAGEYSCST